jgi:uncharacterized protein YwqG
MIAFPPELEPFHSQLTGTRMPFVRIKAGKAQTTTPWQSKVGGMPYLPKGTSWPVSPDGQPLYFLAQINFSEAPALAPFPEKGILQFYINDDDLYGMDFDDGEVQDTFRVLYFPEVSQSIAGLQSGMAISEDYELLPHHPEVSHPLTFEAAEEIAPACDYRFAAQMGAGFFEQFGDKEWELLDTYNKIAQAQGHKFGGYAYFTQDDPRSPEDPMLLLLQIDSDEQMDLMWGDMGVGHFFIREKDLLARDFSRVLYDWDCL